MKIMIVGSNGMVGQGVLNACLKDSGVQCIVLPLRQARADLPQDDRIVPLIVSDLTELSAQDERLSQLDACFSLCFECIRTVLVQYHHIID